MAMERRSFVFYQIVVLIFNGLLSYSTMKQGSPFW